MCSALLSAGSGEGFRTATPSSIAPPAPSGPRALPTRTLPTWWLPGAESPGCPLQTASHIHRPGVLSAAVADEPLSAIRKSVTS